MRVADMIPDTAGVWPLRCHVWSDWLSGMHTLYTVNETKYAHHRRPLTP